LTPSPTTLQLADDAPVGPLVVPYPAVSMRLPIPPPPHLVCPNRCRPSSTAAATAVVTSGNVAVLMCIVWRVEILRSTVSEVREVLEVVRVQGVRLESFTAEIHQAHAAWRACPSSEFCGIDDALSSSTAMWNGEDKQPVARHGAVRRVPKQPVPRRASVNRSKARAVARGRAPARRHPFGRRSRAPTSSSTGRQTAAATADSVRAVANACRECAAGLANGHFNDSFSMRSDNQDGIAEYSDGKISPLAGTVHGRRGRGCRDVSSTGLEWECSNLSRHCASGRYQDTISALCPATCGTCTKPCRDVAFTTFQEDDGSHSSCDDLRHMCRGWETSERVSMLCPVTCGVCVGLVAGPKNIPIHLIQNVTRALERALEQRGSRQARRWLRSPFPPMSAASGDHDRGRREPWRIPQILHQTWKTDAMPLKYAEVIASWRRLHPHWRFQFWDDSQSRNFFSRHFPDYAAEFDGMSGIKRADVTRIVALHVYGGVYADIDVQAVRSFDDLLEAAAEVNIGVLLGEENAVHSVLLERKSSARFVSNAVMASAPDHPFWLEVLDKIFNASRRCGDDPVLCTGPRLIDRLSLAPQQYLGCEAIGCIARLPFDYFSPHIARWNAGSMARACRDMLQEPGNGPHAKVLGTACHRFERALEYPSALESSRTFAVHHWQCSWCREDAMLRQTVPLHELVWRVGNETLPFFDHGSDAA